MVKNGYCVCPQNKVSQNGIRIVLYFCFSFCHLYPTISFHLHRPHLPPAASLNSPHVFSLCLQALAARCEHWTVASEPSLSSPSPPPASSPPSCISSPSPPRPLISPSALPVLPVPLAGKCRLPRYPVGKCRPAQRTTATRGCRAPCPTPL